MRRLSVLRWNVRGIRKGSFPTSAYLKHMEIDIFSANEALLKVANDQADENLLNGFILATASYRVSNPRFTRLLAGGGAAIFVRPGISYSVAPQQVFNEANDIGLIGN